MRGRKKKEIQDQQTTRQTVPDPTAISVLEPIQNEENDSKIDKSETIMDEKDDYGLPKKELLRVDEVATHLSITDRCVRLWVEHGHLEAIRAVGIMRIKRSSVLKCIKKLLPKRI